MVTRTLVVAAAGVVIAVGAAGCASPTGQTAPTPTTATSTSAPPQRNSAETQPSPTTTAPTSSDSGLTTEPCQLLTPSLAEQYAGNDADRRMVLGDPPVPVGGGACYYEGTAGSVLFSINPLPPIPTRR